MIISIVPAAAYLAFMLLSGRFTGVSDDPAVRILWALPDSLTAVIAITGGAVVLLYWIFDRLSREMEFAAGATSSVAEYWFRS
jgi:hypothetical protein